LTRDESNAPDFHAPEFFWAQLAPGDHLVQLFDDERALLDSLEAFVTGGLMLDEGVAVIATPPHLAHLERRLRTRGLDVRALQLADQYIPLDADETLERFMRDGAPDPALFEAAIGRVIERARGHGRPVRAFGEMVALLWSRGERQATLQLEAFWQELCGRSGIALLCGYQKSLFSHDADAAIRQVCGAHSSVVMV
jgi:hypothetical protein